MFKNRLFHTVLCSLSAVAFLGCGDLESKPDSVENNVTGNISTGCIFDTDCDAGFVCEDEMCRAECEFDGDCDDGDICEPRANAAGSVCVGVTTQNNINFNNAATPCAEEPDPNGFCEEIFGGDAFCDTEFDVCSVEQRTGSNLIYIEDITASNSACTNVDDPGSDIQGVELLDERGNSKGWGDLVADAVILDGNFETNYDVVDGSPAALDGDGCVDSFSGNVLALGCGGAIAVQFLDESSNPVRIETGDTVFVYEYGGICGTGTTDDEYTVATCSDDSAVFTGDYDSCFNTLGTGAGVASFSVF